MDISRYPSCSNSPRLRFAPFEPTEDTLAIQTPQSGYLPFISPRPFRLNYCPVPVVFVVEPVVVVPPVAERRFSRAFEGGVNFGASSGGLEGWGVLLQPHPTDRTVASSIAFER